MEILVTYERKHIFSHRYLHSILFTYDSTYHFYWSISLGFLPATVHRAYEILITSANISIKESCVYVVTDMI